MYIKKLKSEDLYLKAFKTRRCFLVQKYTEFASFSNTDIVGIVDIFCPHPFPWFLFRIIRFLTSIRSTFKRQRKNGSLQTSFENICGVGRVTALHDGKCDVTPLTKAI